VSSPVRVVAPTSVKRCSASEMERAKPRVPPEERAGSEFRIVRKTFEDSHPLVFPGRDAETSKFQRVNGNLKVNMTTTDPISASHRFLSCEFLEFEEAQRDKLFTAMGCGPDRGFRYFRKALGDKQTSQEKLRYTRWMALPGA